MLHDVAADLGVTFGVAGSYQRNSERIRITPRIVRAASGETIADAKVDGPLADVFDLQDRVVALFAWERRRQLKEVRLKPDATYDGRADARAIGE